MDTIIFGRVTYQIMASYWPTAQTSPTGVIESNEGVKFAVPATVSKVHSQIADKMNNLPKIVFSRTLQNVEWKNSRLSREVVPEEISRMKDEPGKNIVIYGSADLLSTLSKFNLIDEYRVFVNPILLGNGKPLFKNQKERLKLKLVGSRMFRSGVAGLFYRT